MTKKVAVALSGGVDSSVTALILKNQGYEVAGITARTTDTPESDEVIENAAKVAEKLAIPFYPLDVAEIFKAKVIDYFEQSYKSGETPNPCVMCNKYMKWGKLFDFALSDLSADYVATGHYAAIKQKGDFFKLYPASDEHKDQLYFLFMLEQKQLEKTMFPLSGFTKEQVRKIAFENDLPSKSSKESQDICFIKTPMTAKKYLNNLFAPQKGKFIENKSGRIVGEHSGFWQYTIGQRKGIGIAAPEALYVTAVDAAKNIVYVGYKDELMSDSLVLDNINWSYPHKENDFEALVKIRYNMKAVPAHIETSGSRTIIKFNQKVSAIASGQACVLYNKNDGHLLGGGFIKF